MRSQSAITKLQVVLLIDIIVVVSAAGGYFYLQSIPPPPLDPANTQLADLTLNPTEAMVGQSIKVAVNVTNLGGEAGSYWANFTVDGVNKLRSSYYRVEKLKR